MVGWCFFISTCYWGVSSGISVLMNTPIICTEPYTVRYLSDEFIVIVGEVCMSREEKLDSGKPKDDGDEELGVMKNSNDDGSEGVMYSDFMDRGYYTGTTIDAVRSKHGDYDYIDIFIDVDVDVPSEASYDEVELSFGIPVPEKLKSEGVIPDGTMLAEFVDEVDAWKENEVLSLSDLVGHRIKFMVKEKETDDGTYMNVARTIDDEFDIQGI